jgi:type VI secretion system protein ImpE
MDAKELFKAGKLDEAIAAASDDVKRHAVDSARRGFLCELLCYAGDWSRADAQLDVIGGQDAQLMLGTNMFRQLIRAEQARQQFFAEGRVPEFLDSPAPHVERCLKASVCIRENRPAEAAALLEEAESLRPNVSGICDGRPFADLRDIDDLTAPVFEVLTSNGKYYWIPIERVELIEFRPPEHPRDLLWRRVHMVVRDGPDGEVFLPVLYCGSAGESDERFRMGRLTDWRGGDGSPVRGVGQRMFLIGDDGRGIMELQQITIEYGKPTGP